jgi:hypothetical protein
MTRARSTHRAAADFLAEEWAQTPEGAKRLALTYLMVRDERLINNVAVLGQPYGDWDMGQLFALHCLTTMYSYGHLAVAEFNLSSAPFSDSERRRNQEVLEELPEHVTAMVDPEQRGAEGDGWVEWRDSISGVIEPDGNKETISIKPRSAVLEIGHTDASNTCLHLFQSGAVARWPYGHNILAILTDYPPHIAMRWRFSPPGNPVLADMAEFSNKIALTFMSRRVAWGINGARPSPEERLQNFFQNFDSSYDADDAED